MAAKGSSLSNYNQELVRCIEDLREKREEVNRSILRDEEEKAKIQRELTKMTERLAKLNEDLARKMQVRGALLADMSGGGSFQLFYASCALL